MANRLAHIRRLYGRQEYLTPGAAETVQRIIDVTQPGPGTALLDVACGKLEAACMIAQAGCRVVGVDLYPLFFQGMPAKVEARGAQGLVAIVQADGKRLPVRSGAFDAAYCIGAPSIVGLEACLRELARATRPGGAVVVSDVVWRTKPGALGPEWRWLASMAQLSKDEYASAIANAGLTGCEATVFPPEAWEAYHAPMLQVASEARATGRADDVAFAGQVESDTSMERRAVDAFIDYAMFVARKHAS
ncbi:MAG: methyltransferase domain-containing protein [Dehalococcoidia bacterium]